MILGFGTRNLELTEEEAELVRSLIPLRIVFASDHGLPRIVFQRGLHDELVRAASAIQGLYFVKRAVAQRENFVVTLTFESGYPYPTELLIAAISPKYEMVAAASVTVVRAERYKVGLVVELTPANGYEFTYDHVTLAKAKGAERSVIEKGRLRFSLPNKPGLGYTDEERAKKVLEEMGIWILAMTVKDPDPAAKLFSFFDQPPGSNPPH